MVLKLRYFNFQSVFNIRATELAKIFHNNNVAKFYFNL